MSMKRNLLNLAVIAALTALTTGCGGGGGNTRSEAPAPIPPPPATPPAPPPPPRYTGSADNHIVPINADHAHAAGITGAGVGIGILDSGANRSLASLTAAVASYTNFLPTDPANVNFGNAAIDDVNGHGSVVAQIAAGRAAEGFRGGVAPAASLHIARICRDSDGHCLGGSFIQGATRDLLARGVRIFSHSFGGSVYTPGLNYQGTFDSLVTPEAVAANALFIWAAGNNSGAQPTLESALPVHFSSLSRNWVSVVAANVDEQGNTTRLDSYSSQCGVTAQWCVAAPGAVRFLPTGGVIGARGGGAGTSFATASVTGVAALVSQAFPWMGGNLLQLSILTTARDLGAPGVDDVFGWGMLDAQRAIRGPGQFAFGDVTANVDRAGSWTWANDIGGAGGLVKDGIGTLVLTGQNTYTGATRVNAGTLALNGGRLNSNVTINSGSSFAVRGGTIQGSYTANVGSTTGLQIGGPLIVTGDANLAGTANLLAARGGHTIGGNETLMTAARINGTFSTVTMDPSLFFNSTLVYTPTRLSADLVRKSAAAVAQSLGGGTASIEGASHFDQALALADKGQGSDAFFRAASSVLFQHSSEIALLSLQSMAGEIHGTARNALLATSDQVGRSLGDRVAGLEGEDAGGWASVNVTSGDLNERGFADADTSATTVLAGADVEFGEALLGAVVGVGDSTVELDGLGGRFEADRALLGVYGHQTLGAGYLLGSVTHEWLDVSTRRVAGLEAATANRDDRVFQVRVEAGLNGDFAPYAALRHVRYTQGAFRESGSALGFDANSDTLGATFAELGLRFTSHFTVAGGDATLTGNARYQRLLSDEAMGFLASFTGINAPFTASGQDLRDDMGLLGATFTHSFASGWTWFADAEAEFSGGVMGQRFGLGLRGEF
ncbi:MAG: Extracellular serine protease [Chloroflexi bacterium]|nr:Extracellular serine protease [Chloroflexota bacterium]